MPERVDPGNLIYKTKNTPKVVGAIGQDAQEVIAAMYEAVLEGKVYRVSSPAVAEMDKILENTYRNINIGLINEMAMLYHNMNMLGVAYKQDIDDYRESPAIRVIEEFEKVGSKVVYYDPYVPEYKHKGNAKKGEKALTAQLIKGSDLVVITTAHTKVDYEFVQKNAKVIFDTKNVTKGLKVKENIEIL